MRLDVGAGPKVYDAIMLPSLAGKRTSVAIWTLR